MSLGLTIGVAYAALCLGVAVGFIACAVITGARERKNNLARGGG